MYLKFKQNNYLLLLCISSNKTFQQTNKWPTFTMETKKTSEPVHLNSGKMYNQFKIHLVEQDDKIEIFT